MSSVRDRTKRVRRFVNRLLVFIEDGLPSTLLLLIVCLIFFAVVRRYIFNSPVAYMNELAILLSVWLAALGAASASRRGMHVRIDMAVEALPLRLRATVRLITNACLALALTVFTVLGTQLAIHSFRPFEALGISKGWMIAALPVAFGLMVLHHLTAIYTDIKRIGERGTEDD